MEHMPYEQLLVIPIVQTYIDIHTNNSAPKAQQLKSKYPEIELYKASLDDPSSLEQALKGAYGVFGLTNFWEAGGEGETRQGKALVDAAKANGVKHFIYSTLDNGDPQVPHFVSKWEVDGFTNELL